jgi:hypothetical protein
MRWLLVCALCALAGIAPQAATGAAPRSCGRVVNPYPDTRYDGVDLRRIRATGVSCHRARQVARKAHRKALRLTPPPGGVRHIRWHGWQVTGDIRPRTDRYVARRDGKRVSWLF